ncbi:MAG: hypothetical protein R3315_12300 [Woeseiaceae bacterium]|nr:hypothetical protein [Woeseiaceae bacterium]
MAQRIAAWLVEKPFHGVLGLSFTLLLPFAQFFTGAAITALVLSLGLARSLLLAAAAAALVVLLSLVTGAAGVALLINAALYWIPAALLAALLQRTRSLTLTLQVTALLALLAVIGFELLVADPLAFWRQQIEAFAAGFASVGLEQQASILRDNQDVLAPQMTVLIGVTTWSLMSLVLVLGYRMHCLLPEAQNRYGRFCDLNLGRSLAIGVAVAAVLALVSGAAWLQNVAITGFAAYWLQGLALMHWLRVEGGLPTAVLIVVYGLLLVLNVLLVIALAATGYGDAWLNVRARMKKRAGS